jgi:hypothetical protein
MREAASRTALSADDHMFVSKFDADCYDVSLVCISSQNDGMVFDWFSGMAHVEGCAKTELCLC